MKSNFIKFGSYFLYVLLMYFVLFKGGEISKDLQHYTASTYHVFPKLLFEVIFPIIVGVLLAVPHLAVLSRKPGCWSYDWIKFCAVGLPTLFVTVLILLMYLIPGLNLFRLAVVLLNSAIMQPLSGIVFGYILLASFRKKMQVISHPTYIK